MRVSHYFDYKSPYAFLAQRATYRLAADFDAAVEWLPYTLDIPSYLGRAELDESGEDRVRTRNAHQWRRVRYSYQDARREANRRGLTIRGPRKIFDSSIAHVGFLFAKGAGDWRPYHDAVYERFWRRELDIEEPEAIAGLLGETGYDIAPFPEFLAGDGRRELAGIQSEAEKNGVFGVPSFLVDDELFWGAERLIRVRERLAGAG